MSDEVSVTLSSHVLLLVLLSIPDEPKAVAEMIGVPCTEFKANLLKGLEGINENKRLMRQVRLSCLNVYVVWLTQ